MVIPNTRSVTCRARGSIALPFQSEQDLLEAREVRRAGARPRGCLALRVLELDEVADPLPRRAV